MSESSVTTPQDTVNLASSHLPPAGALEPSHEQYDTEFNSQIEEFLAMANDPFQSYGRYDPSCHLPSTSTASGSLSLEHGLEPYQWDPNTQYFIPQPIVTYASSFPGSSDNDMIYPEFTGSLHLTTSTSTSNNGTVPFPNYDPGYFM